MQEVALEQELFVGPVHLNCGCRRFDGNEGFCSCLDLSLLRRLVPGSPGPAVVPLLACWLRWVLIYVDLLRLRHVTFS